MRAIILAAGSGTRLAPLTENLPKTMLPVEGLSIFERQVQTLHSLGIDQIAAVTGYCSHAIPHGSIRHFQNLNYATTNMVHSLMCAQEWFDQDLVVCYGDVLYSSSLLTAILESTANFSVAVDPDWQQYWHLRYGRIDTDLESLQIQNGLIQTLGQSTDNPDLQEQRYIGLLKFSASALGIIQAHFQRKKAGQDFWLPSHKSFELGYMTDLLNELALAGHPITAVSHSGGWLEFDTLEDYQVNLQHLNRIE